MKVIADKKFQPVSIEIEFESAVECKSFTEMVRLCDSIPEMLLAQKANCDHALAGDMLRKIYSKFKEVS